MKQLSICLTTCFFALLSIMAQAQHPPLVFTPQWTPQSQFAGFYVAMETDFYQEAGVDVIIQHPSSSKSAINKLRQGKCHAIFEKQIASLYELDAPRIVFDCTNLSYISSSGLRILLALLKSVEKRKGTLELHHLRLEIKEDFDMNGFSSFFHIQ